MTSLSFPDAPPAASPSPQHFSPQHFSPQTVLPQTVLPQTVLAPTAPTPTVLGQEFPPQRGLRPARLRPQLGPPPRVRRNRARAAAPLPHADRQPPTANHRPPDTAAPEAAALTTVGLANAGLATRADGPSGLEPSAGGASVLNGFGPISHGPGRGSRRPCRMVSASPFWRSHARGCGGIGRRASFRY